MDLIIVAIVAFSAGWVVGKKGSSAVEYLKGKLRR
jgi:hypothetical protein